MPYQIINSIPVWGEPQPEALRQIENCHKNARYSALMADHHIGYAVPIGGVIAYRAKISPSGVGYDIACGNKAVRLDMQAAEAKQHIKAIMNDIWNTLSFGVGMRNEEQVDHKLFHDDAAWQLPVMKEQKL